MGQYETERNICAIYLFSSAISLIVLIASAVVFGCWSATLNYPCINDVSDGVGRDGYGLGAFGAGDCGCIFYGQAMSITSTTAVGFKGGPTSICHFVIFSPVPAFVAALILGFYHAYRFCIEIPRSLRKLQRPALKSQLTQWGSGDEEAAEEKALKKRPPRGRSPQRKRIDGVKRRARSASPAGRRPRTEAKIGNTVVESNPVKTYIPYEVEEDTFACWCPVAMVAIFIAALALSTAVVATDGYTRTCAEWRRVALRMLQANGDLARVVTTRLSCGAIYDFMDYLQPRKVIHKGFTYEFGGISNSRTVQDGQTTIINTAIGLKITVVAAWINFFVWVSLVVFNMCMAIKRRRLMKKRGKTGSSLCCACCSK